MKNTPSEMGKGRFLPFTNLGSKLRPKYRIPITILIYVFTMASLVPTGFFAIWLAHTLNLRDDVSLRGQPHAILWAMLVISFSIVSLMVFYLASFVVIAMALRFFFGWSPNRIRELIFQSSIPPSWFKDNDGL
jgi:hypothetical protein